jgi:hypothetical protein
MAVCYGDSSECSGKGIMARKCEDGSVSSGPIKGKVKEFVECVSDL